jgi:hypothetical protein
MTQLGPIERKVTQDAADRVAGSFHFAIDREIDGAVHVCAVRSPVAHGEIVGSISSSR